MSFCGSLSCIVVNKKPRGYSCWKCLYEEERSPVQGIYKDWRSRILSNKKWLNRGEIRNTYLTHVSRLSQSVMSSQYLSTADKNHSADWKLFFFSPYFFKTLYTPQQSGDMYQVDVTTSLLYLAIFFITISPFHIFLLYSNKRYLE